MGGNEINWKSFQSDNSTNYSSKHSYPEIYKGKHPLGIFSSWISCHDFDGLVNKIAQVQSDNFIHHAAIRHLLTAV